MAKNIVYFYRNDVVEIFNTIGVTVTNHAKGKQYIQARINRGLDIEVKHIQLNWYAENDIPVNDGAVSEEIMFNLENIEGEF